MSVVYGPPKAGKSFVMLRLAYHVAAGRLFAGRSVRQGVVAYVAAEGGGGIKARLKALRDELGGSFNEGLPIPLYLLPETVNLRDSRADLEPFPESLADLERRAGKLVLIVINTLARAMGGGDENSSVDMGQLIVNLDKIRRVTKAHLAVVHHCGKDEAKGMRGHSSLRGALDTDLVVREGVVRAEDQRDLPMGESFAYQLRSVLIGFDAEGEPVKTAIADVEAVEERTQATNARRLSPLEEKVLAAGRALSEEGSFSVVEIAAAMSVNGCKSSDESIRRTLAKLKDKGLASKSKRGRWAIEADNLSVDHETADETEDPDIKAKV